MKWDTIVKRTKLYAKARNKWGIRGQTIAALEEFAELSVELAKVLNAKRKLTDAYDLAKLVDEVTDAGIMLEQIIFNYKLEADVVGRRESKMSRLERRIKA